MSRNKVQVFYILSLLALAVLLILFAQGVFSGLFAGSGEPVVEINRIDLSNAFYGNYSRISVMLSNNGTISHNFSINVMYDEVLEDSYNVTLRANKTFIYEKIVLTDKIPISENETINSTLRTARFVVYIDEQSEPFEEASFVFNN